ncbi:MAG: hypothetical protein DRI57_13010 [Deltaproteobacteria bacterium]|nr:MAG: hypothetical protein DRI57_13010 [Deltaproteobacteria bacterium]
MQRAEGSSPEYVMASSQDTTGVLDQDAPGDLGESSVSLRRKKGIRISGQAESGNQLHFWERITY